MISLLGLTMSEPKSDWDLNIQEFTFPKPKLGVCSYGSLRFASQVPANLQVLARFS